MELSSDAIERLRRSGIRLDRDGRFWHEGAEVTHAGLRAALWRWLDRSGDGRYVLRVDPERFVFVEVDDAPHCVRSLRWVLDRAFVHLADGSEEELDYRSLVVRDGDRGRGVYCTAHGRFEARLSTAAWGALSERIGERNGEYWLDARGGPHRLGISE